MERRRTLWELVSLRARQSPDSPFLSDEDGRTLTFGEYYSAAERVAAALTETGITARSTVAWQLPTWQEAVVLTAALARLGATQVPLLPFLRERAVSFICQQVDADLLIVPRHWNGFDYAGMAAEVQRQMPALEIMSIDKGGLPETDRAPPTLAPRGGEEAVRWVFYTSGTTGDPKGALHTDEALIATGFGMVGVLELAADDVVPLVFPFTHIGGFAWLVSYLLAGCRCILVERFSGEIMPYLRRHGVTVAGAGAVFAQTYLKEQSRDPNTSVMPGLRCVTGGGSPRPPKLHYDVKRDLNCMGFVSGYGLTECPIAVMNTVRDPDSKLASTEGRPLPGMQISIRASDGTPLAAGEQGVIWLRGPHQCKGYVDAALNTAAFDRDGFLDSGDLGYLDSEGWLTVTGRVKDIIIRKGENISARKVEDALHLHPDIADVVVIGIPDRERGELACAVVQLQDAAAPIDLEELQRFGIDQGLVKQETPERLEYVAVLPRNPSGKVLKEQLKKQFAR